MYSYSNRLCAVILVSLAAAVQAGAQSTTSLRGSVADGTGAMVTGSIVTITNPKTGFTRQTGSDSTGQYQFPQLAPGVYDVKVEQTGFRVAVQSAIPLLVNTPATLNFKLEVGNVGETVNVVAEASSLNTVDASVGNPFSEL